MLQFHAIDLEDQSTLTPLLIASGRRSCEYNFANLYLYRTLYGTTVSAVPGGAVVCYGDGTWLWPLGEPDLAALFRAELEAKGELRLASIQREDVDALIGLFGEERVEVTPAEASEYIYRSEDLANLAGKKYHGKRNHCVRFERANPGYRMEPITPENIAQVQQLNERWYAELRNEGYNLDVDYLCSSGALREFFALELRGALLRTELGPVAWCAGSRQSESCFCTHIEKALYDVEGAYAVVNRDFARMIGAEFSCINREDDAGDEGLRKAKLSYHPAVVLQKYRVRVK